MEEEGVPSTALREVSLLQMLSESIYVVRSASLHILPSRLPDLEPGEGPFCPALTVCILRTPSGC